MSKDYLAINAGRVIFTKYDPVTGALSTDPKDKRICTETISGITRSKSIETYDIEDGNSYYPAGTYETGITYNIGITFTTLNSETLAFLQNAEITTNSSTMKELTQVTIPTVAPYEIETLGTISDTPTVLDSEGNAFTIVEESADLSTNEFKVSDNKLVFSAEDAGKEVTIEYTFEANEVEGYSIKDNNTHPVVQIEIIYETLSRDKTKKYKNNSIISRAQLTGNIDENLAKQHQATTLNFVTVKPAGSDVVINKKTEIPL